MKTSLRPVSLYSELIHYTFFVTHAMIIQTIGQDRLPGWGQSTLWSQNVALMTSRFVWYRRNPELSWKTHSSLAYDSHAMTHLLPRRVLVIGEYVRKIAK